MIHVAMELEKRSTCPRGQAGCVITDEGGFILSTGYNGSPRGLPHCDEVGCLMDGNHCVRTVHAETNAIVTAARNGVKLAGARAYCTMRPCLRCSGLLIQAGITEIVYLRTYQSDDWMATFNLLEAAGVEIRGPR